jgi:NitT/TauT family transport system substrate-binding protein
VPFDGGFFPCRSFLYPACLMPCFAAAAPRLNAHPVRLAIISEGINTWPLYVAQAKKLFEKEGLNVVVTLTASSARQLQALDLGDYDIGFQQSDHIVRGVEQGSELFIFMAQAHAPDLSLVVAPAITSPADFKGKVLAVDGARSGYALLLRRLLADNGLKDGDYTFQEFGGSRQRYDALNSGAAVGSFLNAPFDNRLFAKGFKNLGSIRDFFPSYPGPIAAARRSWAMRNRAQLVGFIRALNIAYTWLQDPANKDEAIGILQARLKTDPKLASIAFDEIGRRPPPRITAEGLQQVIDVVWAAKGFKQPKSMPERYIDLSYLNQASQ